MTVSWLWTFICLLLTHSIFAQINYEVEVSRGRSALSSDLGQGFVDSLKSSTLGEREKRNEAIEYIFSKLLFEWNITVHKEGQGLSSNGTAALIAEEHELAAHLYQVLGVAEKLVRISRACNTRIYIGSSNVTGPEPSCPMLAPELRQGRSLSFLTSLLRTYPHGPTNREALVAWAAAATAFLEEHYRLQVQQRNMTQQVADTAADVAAIYAARRAEENAARKAAKAKRKKGDLVDVNGTGRDDSTPAGGSDDGSSGTDSVEYVDELGSRKLNVAKPGGSGNILAPGGGDDGDDSPDSDSDYSSDFDFDNGDVDDDLLEDPKIPPIPANFTGVKYGSLPLLRRVLLAQLLMGWMNAIRHDMKHSTDVSKIAEEGLVRMVTMLYKIHVESVAQRAIMEYFHISKAGGTSWTAAALASGCELPRANAARYRAFDDDCRWINGSLLRELGVNLHRTGTMQVCSRFDVTERQTNVRSCTSRLHYALNKGFQYISNEYTLHGGLRSMNHTQICPEFVNVISIREPLQRLASNIKYMLLRLRTKMFRQNTTAELFPKLFCNASAATWEMYAPPVADNYNIRTMVGERAFHSPLYEIGEAHEAVAKELLIQYDLVLDLNAGDSAADLIMREGLGWKKTLAEVRIWTVERLAKKTGMDLDADCPVGDLSPIMSRQVYDKRWYSFGRVLSRLDQLFLSAAEHLGLKPWTEDWARVAWGNVTTAMAAASTDVADAADAPPSERTLTSRCGLLGATQVLRHGLET
ncbi:hypothetical protein Vafri_1767 [Volvox africanus]|nr:hypothetical protein Vafri_1767 [Volvox africanus]